MTKRTCVLALLMGLVVAGLFGLVSNSFQQVAMASPDESPEKIRNQAKSFIGGIGGDKLSSLSEDVGNTEARAPILDPSSSRISFQALLTDDLGDPLPGPTVDLSFTIYNNLDFPVEGPIVMNAVPINNGVVDVLVPVTATSFDGTLRKLGVSVDAGPELSPRTELAAVPYSFRVDRVESEELTDNVELGDSSNTGTLSVLGSGGVLTAFIDGGLGLGGSMFLRDGTGTPMILLEGGTGAVKTESSFEIVDFSGGGMPGHFFKAGGGAQIEMFDGANQAVWAGTSASGGGFFNAYQAGGGLTLALDGNDGALGGGVITGRNANVFTTFDIDGDDGGDAGSRFAMWDGATETFRVDAKTGGGAGGPSDGSELTMWNGSSVATVHLDSDDGAGARMTLRDDNNVATVIADGSGLDGGGNITLYNTSGDLTVRIDGDNTDDGFLSLTDSIGTVTVELDSDDGDSGRITLSDRTQDTIILDASGQDGGGAGLFYNSSGVLTTRIDGDNTDDGAIFLSNNAATETVALNSDDGAGSRLTLRDNNSVDTVIVDGSGLGGGGNITVYNGAGDLRVRIDGDNGDAGLISLTNAAGVETITLDSDFGGDGRVITQELQITGGSDLSEQFDINAKSETLQPGMVVCIDPQRPGELRVSTQAYDSTVAGIISGAGGVKPGMLMGQRGSKADGAHPVALTGRVYCLADASNGSIQPGDLLTTSDTPGHCMKVTEHNKARGAILGKAMTSLKDGKDLVLVLVTLQ